MLESKRGVDIMQVTHHKSGRRMAEGFSVMSFSVMSWRALALCVAMLFAPLSQAKDKTNH